MTNKRIARRAYQRAEELEGSCIEREIIDTYLSGNITQAEIAQRYSSALESFSNDRVREAVVSAIIRRKVPPEERRRLRKRNSQAAAQNTQLNGRGVYSEESRTAREEACGPDYVGKTRRVPFNETYIEMTEQAYIMLRVSQATKPGKKQIQRGTWPTLMEEIRNIYGIERTPEALRRAYDRWS